VRSNVDQNDAVAIGELGARPAMFLENKILLLNTNFLSDYPIQKFKKVFSVFFGQLSKA
jgi:hypothetical protein